MWPYPWWNVQVGPPEALVIVSTIQWVRERCWHDSVLPLWDEGQDMKSWLLVKTHCTCPDTFSKPTNPHLSERWWVQSQQHGRRFIHNRTMTETCMKAMPGVSIWMIGECWRVWLSSYNHYICKYITGHFHYRLYINHYYLGMHERWRQLQNHNNMRLRNRWKQVIGVIIEKENSWQFLQPWLHTGEKKAC